MIDRKSGFDAIDSKSELRGRLGSGIQQDTVQLAARILGDRFEEGRNAPQRGEIQQRR